MDTSLTKDRVRRFLVDDTRAQAAFEFILVMPIGILFMFLVVDLSLLMYEYVGVNNAAREGARYGAVNCPPGPTPNCTPGQVKDQTVARSSGILSPSDCVDVYWVDRNGGAASERGDSIVVRVKHPYQFLFGVPYSFPIAAATDMRLEQTDSTPKATGAPGCSA